MSRMALMWCHDPERDVRLGPTRNPFDKVDLYLQELVGGVWSDVAASAFDDAKQRVATESPAARDDDAWLSGYVR